jgi:uncharacterized protein YgiM (DUF1202 family)
MKRFRNVTLLLAISFGLGCQTLNLLSALSPSPTPTARPKPTATELIAQAVAPPTELPAAPPTEAPPLMATIKENNLRVRAAPNANAAVVDHLNKGDTVQVVGRTTANDWLQISQPQKPDKGGWIAAQYAQVNGSLDTVPIAQPGQPGALPTSPREQPQPPSQPYPAPPSRAYP